MMDIAHHTRREDKRFILSIFSGLALGSHSSACWPHVFNACVAVANLEHVLFSKSGSTQLLMVAQNTQNNTVTSTTYSNTAERLNLSYNPVNDEETW